MSQRTEELLADSPPALELAAPRALSVPWPATWIMLLSLAAIVNALLVVANHAARGFFVPVLAAAICLLAALFDACTTRIPNALTYTAILLGIAVNAAGSLLLLNHADTATRWLAAPTLSQSLLGFGACALVGIAGMVIARVGGGDIKLLAALGALLGLSQIGYVLIVALTVAALYALINLVVVGRLNFLARLAALRLLELFYFRRFELPSSDDSSDRPASPNTIPMAVPLAIGLILTQLLDLQTKWGTPP
jgi:prepilin signal peptidase PulO-like enzyme (type II secretory pathway)